jgi:hypothetical protein
MRARSAGDWPVDAELVLREPERRCEGRGRPNDIVARSQAIAISRSEYYYRLRKTMRTWHRCILNIRVRPVFTWGCTGCCPEKPQPYQKPGWPPR